MVILQFTLFEAKAKAMLDYQSLEIALCQNPNNLIISAVLKQRVLAFSVELGVFMLVAALYCQNRHSGLALVVLYRCTDLKYI